MVLRHIPYHCIVVCIIWALSLVQQRDQLLVLHMGEILRNSMC